MSEVNCFIIVDLLESTNETHELFLHVSKRAKQIAFEIKFKVNLRYISTLNQ